MLLVCAPGSLHKQIQSARIQTRSTTYGKNKGNVGPQTPTFGNKARTNVLSEFCNRSSISGRSASRCFSKKRIPSYLQKNRESWREHKTTKEDNLRDIACVMRNCKLCWRTAGERQERQIFVHGTQFANERLVISLGPHRLFIQQVCEHREKC